MWYCSTECQRAHWTDGGHKKQCKLLQATTAKAGAVSATTHLKAAVSATTPAAGGSDGGSCIICLESDPPPIQSGCACRGDAGLVHLECRILAAEHKQKLNRSINAWQECPTCQQLFVGPVGLGLAEELLRRTRDNRRPDQLGDWIAAAGMVSRTLIDVGKFAEAEAVCRDTISEFEQMGVDRAGGGGVMSGIRMLMGLALGNQGKQADAQLVFERCVTEFTQKLGPIDERTLSAARALGNNLNIQGKHAEAVTILRDARRRSKRALGPENILTLQCGLNLGFALTCQQNFDLADAVFREVLPALKRVLGPDHPLSLQASGKYAECLAGCGRHTEAEAMLVDTLAAQARVLGAGHPDTQMSVQMLARIRNSMPMARK